jgi:hypothetical protein
LEQNRQLKKLVAGRSLDKQMLLATMIEDLA